jgi:hypothetical protein
MRFDLILGYALQLLEMKTTRRRSPTTNFARVRAGQSHASQQRAEPNSSLDFRGKAARYERGVPPTLLVLRSVDLSFQGTRPTRGEHEAALLSSSFLRFVNKTTTILLTRHHSQRTILRRVVKSGRKWVQPRSKRRSFVTLFLLATHQTHVRSRSHAARELHGTYRC